MCRWPQMTPSRAACSPRAACLRPLVYRNRHGLDVRGLYQCVSSSRRRVLLRMSGARPYTAVISASNFIITASQHRHHHHHQQQQGSYKVIIRRHLVTPSACDVTLYRHYATAGGIQRPTEHVITADARPPRLARQSMLRYPPATHQLRPPVNKTSWVAS